MKKQVPEWAKAQFEYMQQVEYLSQPWWKQLRREGSTTHDGKTVRWRDRKPAHLVRVGW